MARATVSTFGQFIVSVGDGEDPEVFTKICGLRSKSFGVTNATQTTQIPDCDDEDAPAYEEAQIVSQTMPLSGSGLFAREMQALLLTWAEDGAVKNIRVYPGQATVTGDVSYYAGPALLQELTITGERGDKIQANMTFAFVSRPTRTLVP